MGQTPLSRTPRQGGRAKSDGQHQNGVEDKESADSDKDRMSLSIKAHTHNGCSHQQHSVGEDLSLPKTPKPKKTQDHRDHKRRIPECHRIPLDIHSDTAQKHDQLHIDGPTSNNAKSEHSARAAGTTFFAETMLAPPSSSALTMRGMRTRGHRRRVTIGSRFCQNRGRAGTARTRSTKRATPRHTRRTR